ncbi:MAG: M48 family metallopeptidase [Phycisphaerales bacterium]|jgi:predicted Zn-dependent protease
MTGWKLWTLAGVILAAAFAGGCTYNKTTGRSQFNALSRDEEIQIGTQGKAEMTKEYGGEVAKAELRQYVTEVGMKLVKTTAVDDPDYQTLPWEFTLLDSDVINAFALPGGKVFMSRGLAVKLTNEAELAGVLGHEVGHVMARHTNERFARAAGLSVGAGLVDAILGGDIATTLAGNFGDIALRGYDRSQESEADTLGVRYMVRANYNPVGQQQVMELLDTVTGKDGRPPEFLSTHPDPGKRAKAVAALISSQYPTTQNNPAYVLKEAEYRQRFLSKISLAYPNADESRLARTPDELPPPGAMGILGGEHEGDCSDYGSAASARPPTGNN